VTRARDVANIDGVLTTKGDIYAATAAATPARLGVGSNGETLVADSSTSTGLRYQGNFAAGKNKIINSDMSIWQRGATFNVGSAAYTFTADRYKVYSANSSTTVSRDTSAPTGFNFSLKLQRPNGNTGTNSLGLAQITESANITSLKGQYVTLSFWIKKGANYSGGNITATILTGTGTDQGGDPYGWTGLGTVVNDGSYNPTTSFVRVSYSGTVPTTVNEIAVVISYTPTGTAGADDALYVTGIQLEAGAMTTYQTATGTIQGELAACQRYYYLYVDGNTSTSFGTCAYFSASDVLGTITYPVTMRTTPTFSAAAGSFYEVVRAGGSNTLTALQANYLTTRTANIFASAGQGASGTTGHAGQYRTISVSANAAFSAEL
jgi:hypothetical protein